MISMRPSPAMVREAAQAARLHSEELRARSAWNRRRLARQRRLCQETLAATIVTLADAGAGPVWDALDIGELDEIDDVAPTLHLVPDPDS